MKRSLTKDCKILRETMGTVGEICVLVKYFPKREKCYVKQQIALKESLTKKQLTIRQVNWTHFAQRDEQSVLSASENKGYLSSIITTYER